jgi:hypothetical protein
MLLFGELTKGKHPLEGLGMRLGATETVHNVRPVGIRGTRGQPGQVHKWPASLDPAFITIAQLNNCALFPEVALQFCTCHKFTNSFELQDCFLQQLVSALGRRNLDQS